MSKSLINLRSTNKNRKMKKLIYTGAFALLALGFVACSEATEEITNAADDMEMSTEDEISEETTEELNKTIEVQEKAEQLDADLNEFIESL